MIVFGDSEFYARPGDLAYLMRVTTDHAHRQPSLERLRTWVIWAGQVEQAFEDLDPQTGEAAQVVTDAIAEAFVAAWHHDPDMVRMVNRAASLSEQSEFPARELRVKLPEGFANYALYPEQYIGSAEKWMRANRAGGVVTVIGLRSIGTGLSAVVAAALRRAGYSTRRATTRPRGHPFERRVQDVPAELERAERVLIVDEGPGLSGSSMAAAAMAAREVGGTGVRISFFPGHPHGPGTMASELIRDIWRETPQFTTDVEELRWSGNSLAEELSDATVRILGGTVQQVDDFSAGQWRRTIDRDETEWPAAALQFENRKICIRLQDGRAALWKFSGMAVLPNGWTGAENAVSELSGRAEAGWNAKPLGHHLGYVASPWLDGSPLREQDLTDEFWQYMLNYVGAVRKPSLDGSQATAAFDRIGEMLAANCREALGDKATSEIRHLHEIGQKWVDGEGPAVYGDGRLAPHEWIRASDGRIWKVDGTGHDWDHTIVGSQAWLWDVAGLMTEWNIEPREEDVEVPEKVLRFYGAAYAAFRMGLMVEGGKSINNPDEKGRMRRAAERYKSRLLRWLG